MLQDISIHTTEQLSFQMKVPNIIYILYKGTGWFLMMLNTVLASNLAISFLDTCLQKEL